MKKAKRRVLLLALFTTIVLLFVCGMLVYERGSFTVDASNSKAAPTIIVDTGEYDLKTIPNAYLNSEYSVFPAKAKSQFGNDVEVKTKVYLYYYSQTASRINLIDDKFIPKYYGVYTVEYTATDEYGTAITTYDVVCEEKEPLSVDFVGGDSVGVCGAAVKVADLTFRNANGKTNYSVISAKLNDNVSYEIIDGEFVPLYAGEYTIEYSYSDYNERGTTCYTVEVSSVDSPVIMNEVSLPKYMLVNYEYILPKITCYNFISGTPVDVIPDIEITDANNDKLNVSSSLLKYKPTVEGVTKITYSFESNGKKAMREFIVRVVDVDFYGTMKFDKYFYSDTVSATETNDYVQLSTEKDGRSEFINTLPSYMVETRISWESKFVKFNKLNVYITDSQDEIQTIKISLCKNTDGKLLLDVNDNDSNIETSNSFNDDGVVYLSFSESEGVINLGSDVSLKVIKYLSGEAFKGFGSGKIYLSYAFEGVNGDSRINVESIDNQSIYKATSDGIEPYTLFTKYTHGEHKLGDIATIERVYIGDVLSPELLELEYGILKPDGNFLVLNDGIDYTKPYSFKLEQLGKYNVYIFAKDCFGNESNYSYAISVIDDVTPDVKLSGKNKAEYQFGSKVKFANATANDNEEGEVAVFVYVITPNLQVVSVKDSYIITQRGKHTVVYYAVDSVGNYTQIKNEFIVK